MRRAGVATWLELTRRGMMTVAVVAPAVLSGCFGGTALPEAQQLIGPPPLAPGDRIRISVFNQDRLGEDADIDDAGTVNVALIGRVSLSDLRPQDAEQLIATRLAHGFIVDPRVSVVVLHYRSIYVLGEVTKPGAYEYTPNLTVLDAVALAGGYSRRARESRVTIRRRPGMNDTPQLALPTTRLLPGDVVEVPERYF